MSFPYSESAPVTEIKLDIDWIQCPCGKASTVTFDESIESSENSSGSSKQSYISSSETRDSIQKIVRSGSIAIKNAEIFKKEFGELMQQSEISYETMMKDYAGPVVWLKDAMDSLEKLKQSSSESEKMKYAYEVMQQYAHGIEYIIQDQIAAGISKQFLAKFNDVRTFLKAVLCETHWVMTNDLGIVPREPKSPITHIPLSRNGSERALEDWIIYTDYITVMKDIINELQKLCGMNEKI